MGRAARHLKNTGLLKKKMPDKFLTKPYETPAVEAPHPGRFFVDRFTEATKILYVPPNRNNNCNIKERSVETFTAV